MVGKQGILLTLLFLFLLNIFLSVNIYYQKNCLHQSGMNTITKEITQNICDENKLISNSLKSGVNIGFKLDFNNINTNLGRWDNQRIYQFLDFALIGTKYEDLSRLYQVCLATQTSIERLHFLVQTARHWTGPISVGVFIASDEEYFILQHYITYLRLCYLYVNERVTFHIAKPTNYLTGTIRLDKIFNFDCDSPETVLKTLLKFRGMTTIRYRQKNLYPQNHMRNLARKGCQTDYVFLTDVDIVPSINMTNKLDAFIRKYKCVKKCAFVIPTYELDFRVKYPNDKRQLLRFVKKGLARPFHEKVFIYNQFATNFSRWENDDSNDSEVYISHNVTNFEFLYEPFYVANDHVPIHDERFMGYGFTRNSQVFEMYLAGFEFLVLSPIFTIHWGLQQKKSRPAWREHQNNINRKRFDSFKKEIFLRYKKNI